MSTTPENEPTTQPVPEPSQQTTGFSAAYPPPPPGGAAAPSPRGASGGEPTPRGKRTAWVPVLAAAVAGALVASLATLGITGTLTAQGAGGPGQASPADLSTIGQHESENVPVTGSTADEPDWRAVAQAVRSSVVAIDVRTRSGAGKGSGVILDEDGRVLTNDHVVGDAVDDGIRVTLADGRIFGASILGTDPTTDLAVIELDDPPSDLTPAVLGDSDEVQVGSPVMAVGNPLGLDSTVTTGIVSAINRPVTTSDGGDDPVVTNAIQIDAAINPGNSGGPLFNAQGEVIGITSSIASLSRSSATAGSIGLGFAIPSALAQRVAAQLIDDGTADHAFLGVSLKDGEATADGTTRRGAEVVEVVANSPADDAGLREGDVVVAIGNEPVNGAESLTAFVRERPAGTGATLTVVRDGEALNVDVTFAVRDETPARQGSEQQGPGQQGPGQQGSEQQGPDGRQGSNRGPGSDSDQRPSDGAQFDPWDWFQQG